MSRTLFDLPLKRIDGTVSDLSVSQGKVLLVVNVASECGLTPQYEGLEALYQSRQELGLEVLGFPANNFKGQEPGSDEEILQFCTVNYGVHFPLFSKISVRGPDRHPLYAVLTAAQPVAIGDGPFREKLKGFSLDEGDPADVLWNFEKFLISRTGDVVARFGSDVAPDDPRLVKAVDTELAKLA